MTDLLAPCPACGFYRDTPNHEYGCAPSQETTDSRDADRLHAKGPSTAFGGAMGSPRTQRLEVEVYCDDDEVATVMDCIMAALDDWSPSVGYGAPDA